MPPTHCPEAQDAIREMDEALARIRAEALDLHDSDAWKNGEGDARERYRGLYEKYYNLKAVIDALKAATIVYGLTGDELGNTNKRTTPPTITLNNTWQGARTAVVAQILAHEAMHVLANAVGNSIDQEVRCRRKEMEVWELLKGTTHHALDLPCDNEQRAFAQGEDYLRRILRGLYPRAPEHDVPPPREGEKSGPKKGRIKVERARYAPVPGDPIGFAFDLLADLAATFVGDALTDGWYAFDVHLPRRWTAHETVGLHESFAGVIATAPKAGVESFTATVSVLEEPDVLHGGAWPGYAEKAGYHREATAFNAGVFDARAETLVDLETEVGGRPAHVLESAYDVFHRPDPERWRLRLRERVIFTQRDDMIYTLALVCEATEWARRLPAFERAAESFRAL